MRDKIKQLLRESTENKLVRYLQGKTIPLNFGVEGGRESVHYNGTFTIDVIRHNTTDKGNKYFVLYPSFDLKWESHFDDYQYNGSFDGKYEAEAESVIFKMAKQMDEHYSLSPLLISFRNKYYFWHNNSLQDTPTSALYIENYIDNKLM